MVQGYWIIGCIFFIKFPSIKQHIPIQQSADHKLIDFELLSIDFTKRVKSNQFRFWKPSLYNNIPAATVWLVPSSTKIKLPVPLILEYGS